MDGTHSVDQSGYLTIAAKASVPDKSKWVRVRDRDGSCRAPCNAIDTRVLEYVSDFVFACIRWRIVRS
jgi:hypothetical protein